MSGTIDRVVGRYERGEITRRELIASLTALVATPRVTAAQPARAPIRVRSLNHVTLTVSDIPRAEAFYRRVFGLPVQSRQGTGVNLACGAGPQFVGLYGGDGADPDIGHFCLGVAGFDADAIVARLADHGVEARVRMREGTIPEIYFADPDGLMVQVQDVRYCGGSGPLGSICQ